VAHVSVLAFLLNNPTLVAIGGAVIAAMAAWMHGRVSGARAQANSDKAKEADSYARHIQEISDAAHARPSGSVLNDPNNRDRP
jgi:hypothetical protein